MNTQYIENEISVVNIMGTEITCKEWDGQQVVTFADIDAVHQRPKGTAKRNFIKNREYFLEDRDYYNVTLDKLKEISQDEFRTTGIFEVNSQGTIFVTERGYYKIIKSMKDKLSWKIFDCIIDNYFHYRAILSSDNKINSDNNELEFTIPWPNQIMNRLSPCIRYINDTTDPNANMSNVLGEINKQVCTQYGADFKKYTEVYKKENPNDNKSYILSIVNYFPKLRKVYDEAVNKYIEYIYNA